MGIRNRVTCCSRCTEQPCEGGASTLACRCHQGPCGSILSGVGCSARDGGWGSESCRSGPAHHHAGWPTRETCILHPTTPGSVVQRSRLPEGDTSPRGHRENPIKSELAPVSRPLEATFGPEATLAGVVGPAHQEPAGLPQHSSRGTSGPWIIRWRRLLVSLCPVLSKPTNQQPQPEQGLRTVGDGGPAQPTGEPPRPAEGLA